MDSRHTVASADAQYIAIELLPDDAPVQPVGASVRITIPTRTTKGEALVAPGREPFRFEEDGDGNPVVIGAGFHCFPNANGQRTNNDVALLGKWLVGMVAPRARASRSLRNRLLLPSTTQWMTTPERDGR